MANKAPFQVGPMRPLELDFSRFAAQEQVANRRSSVARYTVPKAGIVALEAGAAFQLRLKGRVEIVQTDAGASAVLDLGAAGLRIAASPRGLAFAASLPTVGHPDVIVYAGGNELVVEAVDYDNNTVTVTNPAAGVEQTYTVYGQLQQGRVQLVAVAPASIDNTGERLLFDSPLRALHEVQQSESRTAPRIRQGRGRLLPLGPQWRLDVVLNTPASVVWNAEARQEILLQAQDMKVEGDLIAAGRQTEAALR